MYWQQACKQLATSLQQLYSFNNLFFYAGTVYRSTSVSGLQLSRPHPRSMHNHGDVPAYRHGMCWDMSSRHVRVPHHRFMSRDQPLGPL